MRWRLYQFTLSAIVESTCEDEWNTTVHKLSTDTFGVSIINNGRTGTVRDIYDQSVEEVEQDACRTSHERFSQRGLVAGNFDEGGRPVISHDPNGMTTPLHLIGGKQWGRQHSPKMVSVGMGLCSKQCGSRFFSFFFSTDTHY